MAKLNLLIVHDPSHQALSEWRRIADGVAGVAPEIDVRIVRNGGIEAGVHAWLTSRPSLVFSLRPIIGRVPSHGKIYANRLLTKWEEIDRMFRSSLPVPGTTRLSRDTRLAVSVWGDFVITKPIYGARGENVRLIRTGSLADRYEELVRRTRKPLIAQRFVEHVDGSGRPRAYRVYVLFGRELYASSRRWLEPRRPLAEIADDPDGVIADNGASVSLARELCFDEDVIQLARDAHAVFPELPALGVDIIRESGTGKLFVLEVNSGGPGWYFAAPIAMDVLDPNFVHSIRGQFNYIDRTVELLVAKTRAEAT